jgi:Predicted xylanase/chitin deacetylase
MSKAYLTIDDSPTKITPDIVNYLIEKGITPILNFIGQKVSTYFDESVYAVKKGAIIGNHSYSHTPFSELSLDECKSEIQKTEYEIDRVYKAAGIERKYHFFRFPYGNKGGENQNELQDMFRNEFYFDRLDDTNINFHWWKENHLNRDIDLFWTFDFEEYRLPWKNGYTWNSILEKIYDKNPVTGGVLLENNATHIILMHDTEETNDYMYEYYRKIIDYAIAVGVEFIQPKFTASFHFYLGDKT